MALTKEEFRRVLGHFGTGVTIVTITDEEGKPYGLTVNSFTSVSLDPFLVLICIDHSAQGYSQFAVGKYFGVSILTEEQQELSNRFADRMITNRFENLHYLEGRTGVPLLANSLATLECRIIQAYPGGDHTIFVGAVEVTSSNEGRPLMFYRGRYTKLLLEGEN
jgi:flavin reductase (DIM6/NTAB) family NADH-FMN oxidoreductase RutF